MRLLLVCVSALTMVGAAPDLDAILDPVHSFLSYYESHPDLIDVNLVFGVLLIKGEIGRLQKIEDVNKLKAVEEVLTLCNSLLTSHKYDWSVSPRADQLVLSLNKRPIVKSLPLTGDQPTYNLEDSLEAGSPTRNESDTCLLSLLIDGEILNDCETLERDPAAKGYPLLHQAIYFTIKSHLFDSDSTASQGEIRRICSLMLGENRLIKKLGFPMSLQDLFVEQVAVCGLSKFTEFLSDATFRMVQSLQTSRGCFSLREKGKRLQIDCIPHLSAVCAVALSVFVTV